jgi:hypothetical protein
MNAVFIFVPPHLADADLPDFSIKRSKETNSPDDPRKSSLELRFARLNARYLHLDQRDADPESQLRVEPLLVREERRDRSDHARRLSATNWEFVGVASAGPR